MAVIINGIQQIGIGVTNTKNVFNWYREHLGFNILLFSDEATANLMTRYTQGEPQRRDAYLSLNMKGGGGLEIWQFKDRVPNPPKEPILLGDLGINAMILRTGSIMDAHRILSTLSLKNLTSIATSKTGRNSFYFKDPWGNLVQIVEDPYSFGATKTNVGGVMGAVIGVLDMDTSIAFYSSLLGYTQIVSDETEMIRSALEIEQQHTYRKVLLRHERKVFGGFGDLLGPTEIELIQSLDREPVPIFENRLWGDLGYIHLCFDVQGMASLREKAAELGHAFTVDSANSFDMGDAAGHFSYVEDPDGTLIEFVETHKVPILKKLGLYLNLKKRNPKKPLPKWLVKTLGFHKVKQNL
jgi:catechol 2,3-dioxygenase-like lactoylglutathione lyase family enzyme